MSKKKLQPKVILLGLTITSTKLAKNFKQGFDIAEKIQRKKEKN